MPSTSILGARRAPLLEPREHRPPTHAAYSSFRLLYHGTQVNGKIRGPRAGAPVMNISRVDSGDAKRVPAQTGCPDSGADRALVPLRGCVLTASTGTGSKNTFRWLSCWRTVKALLQIMAQPRPKKIAAFRESLKRSQEQGGLVVVAKNDLWRATPREEPSRHQLAKD